MISPLPSPKISDLLLEACPQTTDPTWYVDCLVVAMSPDKGIGSECVMGVLGGVKVLPYPRIFVFFKPACPAAQPLAELLVNQKSSTLTMRLWPILVHSDYERVSLAGILPCAVVALGVAAVVVCVVCVGGTVRIIKLDIITHTSSSTYIHTYLVYILDLRLTTKYRVLLYEILLFCTCIIHHTTGYE